MKKILFSTCIFGVINEYQYIVKNKQNIRNKCLITQNCRLNVKQKLTISYDLIKKALKII